MAEVFQQLYSINIVNYVGVEDFADRLSFLFTVSIISVCCALTTVMSYLVRPIVCHMPNTFGEFFDGKDISGQIEYATNFCWTEGTYAVHPLNFSIDATATDGGLGAYADRKIVYYQWVPFLLALQGVMSYLPRLLWHSVSYDRAGTDVGHIVKVASDASHEDEETHDKLVTYACRMIELMLNRTDASGAAAGDAPQSQFVRARSACAKCVSLAMPSRLTGSWLILTYLVIKVAYLANAIGQLVIMQHFLQLSDSHYNLLGISLLRDVIAGRDWQNTMAFPRIGCCAVFLRTGAGGNWQFSQCSLPVNLINEKVYIFLWFWFTFVAAATLASLGTWMYRLVNATLTCRFVKKYLRLADNYAELKNCKGVTRGFLHQFLRRDGAFVLKMIALNAGDVVCAEIIQRLWDRYLVIKGYAGEAGTAEAGAEDDVDGNSGGARRRRKPEKAVLRLSCDRMPRTKAEGAAALTRRLSGAAASSAAGAATSPAVTDASATKRQPGFHQERTLRLRRDVSFYLHDSGEIPAASTTVKPDSEALEVTTF